MDGSKENGRRKKMKINRTRERILDKSIELFNRKQASNVSTHFQNREFVRHYFSGKSSYTKFAASKDGDRKSTRLNSSHT